MGTSAPDLVFGALQLRHEHVSGPGRIQMGVISTAAVFAEEAAGEGINTSPWVFGITAFVGLGVLLVITLMIKVGR